MYAVQLLQAGVWNTIKLFKTETMAIGYMEMCITANDYAKVIKLVKKG